jgi:hypothetical protein
MRRSTLENRNRDSPWGTSEGSRRSSRSFRWPCFAPSFQGETSAVSNPLSGYSSPLRSAITSRSRTIHPRCFACTPSPFREGGAAEDLLRHRRDGPVDQLRVRPAMATDQGVIRVHAHEQQQQMGGPLEAEPWTQRRLGTIRRTLRAGSAGCWRCVARPPTRSVSAPDTPWCARSWAAG